MTYSKRNSANGKNNVLLVTPAEWQARTAELDDLAEQYCPSQKTEVAALSDPLEDLIATAEATFEFIRNADIDPALKRAFYQLEKKFEYHRKFIDPPSR